MKKHRTKIVSILVITLAIISIGLTTYGHSGRTDANGGHRDNQNKSGLGSYHYHCGGHPAHLHTNGVCPYSSKSSSSKNKSTSSSTTKKKKSTSTNTSTSKSKTKSTSVSVKEIKINEDTEDFEDFEVGNSKVLSVDITPSNVTDKKIKWKSSDEDIAEVTSSGKVIAKNPGIVTITATSDNGKTSTIKINVNEPTKLESISVLNTTANSNNNVLDDNNFVNTLTNNEEKSNPLGTVLVLGILAGGGYLGYKKCKKAN